MDEHHCQISLFRLQLQRFLGYCGVAALFLAFGLGVESRFDDVAEDEVGFVVFDLAAGPVAEDVGDEFLFVEAVVVGEVPVVDDLMSKVMETISQKDFN